MTDKELVPYSEFTNQMEALREKADFLPDMSTDEGYEASRRISLDYRKLEIRVDAERKKQKKYWIDGGKAVDAKGKGVEGDIFKLRESHAEAYQKVDAEKKEREAKRIAGLEDRLRYIQNLTASIQYSSSDEIKLAMEAMQAEECLKFYEFTAAALEARNATRTSLGELYVAKLQHEKDAAELAEFKRKQAEQVIADKVNERVAKVLEAQVAPVQEAEPLAAPIDYAQPEDRGMHRRSEVNNQALNDLVGFGLGVATAKKLIGAIYKKQISNITINY